MSNGTGTITAKLASYISRLSYADLPPDVVTQAKKVILDALAGQVACSLLENGKLIIEFGKALGGPPEASVFGGGFKVSAVAAALVNGTLGHGDEIDESLEEVGHASAVMVPSAFACAEKTAASGKDLITAVVAGYDIAGRLADAGVSMSKLMFRYNQGTMSSLWAAATAARALRLDAERTRIALGLAACQSGGFYDLGSEARHMAKSLMLGLGSRNGVSAALLARLGYDGPASVFDGENNVVAAAAGKGYDPAALTRGLGKKFVIMDTCIKLYSAGHPIHAPADGMFRIMAREKLKAPDIKAITVKQPEHEQKIVDNRDMPNICLQYCLAVAAFDGVLTWDQYEPERLNDPKVAELRRRIRSIHDPELDARKKVTKAHSAEVEVETYDGRRFVERVDYPPGDPGNPVTQADVDRKAVYYASKVLGDTGAQRLVEAVKHLEAIRDINELGGLLRQA